ncbi:MAG: hypothetical protein ACR2RE_20290, partial [Geminicoccaceae bacterium]
EVTPGSPESSPPHHAPLRTGGLADGMPRPIHPSLERVRSTGDDEMQHDRSAKSDVIAEHCVPNLVALTGDIHEH